MKSNGLSASFACLSCIIPVFLALATVAPAASWPQWRGPNRDGTTSEPAGTWPPQELWRKSLGPSEASPIIVNGKVYVMELVSGKTGVKCLNASDGAVLWSGTTAGGAYGRYATGDQNQYSGPEATPACDGSLLFTLSSDGDLQCWDAGTGAKKWGFNLYSKYSMGQRPIGGSEGLRDYGYTSSPMLAGNNILVEVGGTAGVVGAFRKSDGALVSSWGTGYPGHSSGPSGPDGKIFITLTHLWINGQKIAWATDWSCNLCTPAFAGNKVVYTSAYNMSKTCCYESGALKWTASVYETVHSPTIHASKDNVYLAGVGKCLSLSTGATKFSFGGCSSVMVTGDDTFIACDTKMRLYNASGTKLAEVSGVTRGWPTGALGEGKLLFKNRNTLVCWAVASASPPAAPGSTSASALSGTSIKVTWQDNASDEDGFKLDRRESGTDPWVRIATPSANSTSYTDSGLAAGTTFYYKVKAHNAAGDSAYSNVAGAATPAPSGQVRISNATDEGLACFKVETDNATYYYDKAGGGFTSLLDTDGTDWISFHPQAGSGSAGEYRGIPNTGELHPGYTGGTTTTADALGTWLSKATINTTRNNWKATWEFFPTYAKMTLNQVPSGGKYWMLYEGTPGGAVDASDRLYLSNGRDYSANADHPWKATKAAPDNFEDIANTSGKAVGSEWVYFAASEKTRSLYLVHTDDGIEDDYWQMEDNMTVFGFGRNDSTQPLMTQSGAVLMVGFVDSKTAATVQGVIDSVWDGAPPPPDAPSGLSAAVLSSTSIQLTWTDNSGDET
ncbi:MAG: fibronectin type III domain-containing protein, partial [Kiritimatiellae bacterium]|nr:fibronectin type III domain-containing protein [Kiritimatiellia bacterium]